MSRPAILAQLKRALLTEAGYRCAIPTCRGTSSLQFEHIDEWHKVKEHKFENMIILCANCHARVTSKEIHKDAIRKYKNNLAILTGRYTTAEWRLLDFILDNSPDAVDQNGKVRLRFPQSDQVTYYGLVKDGYIVFEHYKAGIAIGETVSNQIGIVFTQKGVELLQSYKNGQTIQKVDMG